MTPIREQFVRDARLPLLALTGAAVAFLLVACANLAALQISAFESRRAEIAVRAALGATAGRLAGQLAVEAMVLALVAGVTGMLVADYVLAVLPERLPPNLPFLTSAVLDFRIAIVAVLTAIGSGLLIAAWPVGHLLRSGPTPRGVAPGARGSVFRVLVAGQVAVSITLVVSAALLMQSLWSWTIYRSRLRSRRRRDCRNRPAGRSRYAGENRRVRDRSSTIVRESSGGSRRGTRVRPSARGELDGHRAARWRRRRRRQRNPRPGGAAHRERQPTSTRSTSQSARRTDADR